MSLFNLRILRILTILLAISLSIASIAMVFMIILTMALAAMVIVLVVRGISEDFTVAIVFGVLSIASVVIAAMLFRKIVV